MYVTTKSKYNVKAMTTTAEVNVKMDGKELGVGRRERKYKRSKDKNQ